MENYSAEKEYRELKHLVNKALEEALGLGASYVDVRYHHGTATSLRVRKGIVESSSISTFNGMGIRVLKDGSPNRERRG